MKCDRCGWDQDPNEIRLPPEIEGWPEELPPPPPLPNLGPPHPTGVCPSPFEIGEQVWWDVAEACPDLPPIRGFFAGLHSFNSPSYTLEDGAWVVRGTGYGLAGAWLIVDKSSVLPGHPEFDEGKLAVRFNDLTSVGRWPVSVGDA